MAYPGVNRRDLADEPNVHFLLYKTSMSNTESRYAKKNCDAKMDVLRFINGCDRSPKLFAQTGDAESQHLCPGMQNLTTSCHTVCTHSTRKQDQTNTTPSCIAKTTNFAHLDFASFLIGDFFAQLLRQQQVIVLAAYAHSTPPGTLDAVCDSLINATAQYHFRHFYGGGI